MEEMITIPKSLLENTINDLEESARHGAYLGDLGEDGLYQQRANELKEYLNKNSDEKVERN